MQVYHKRMRCTSRLYIPSDAATKPIQQWQQCRAPVSAAILASKYSVSCAEATLSLQEQNKIKTVGVFFQSSAQHLGWLVSGKSVVRGIKPDWLPALHHSSVVHLALTLTLMRSPSSLLASV